jgi:hypothetical protein
MSDADRVRQLVRGDILLAELAVRDRDSLWLNARVRPAVGLEESVLCSKTSFGSWIAITDFLSPGWNSTGALF